jgi:hypothetical protein
MRCECADLAGMCRRLMILAVLAAVAAGAIAPSAQAGWSPTVSGGVNLDAARGATSPSLAIIGATPWLAWREDSGTGAYQVHVARWNGSAWTLAGGVLNVDTSRNAYLPQLVDVAGTPWVAWTETNGSAYQVRVKRWTGSSWVAVGGALNVDTSKNANEPGMASPRRHAVRGLAGARRRQRRAGARQALGRLGVDERRRIAQRRFDEGGLEHAHRRTSPGVRIPTASAPRIRSTSRAGTVRRGPPSAAR